MSIRAEVSMDNENFSKLLMKKNCVVNIAKMAWLDEVSRRERGQEKAKAKKTVVDDRRGCQMETTRFPMNMNPKWRT